MSNEENIQPVNSNDSGNVKSANEQFLQNLNAQIQSNTGVEKSDLKICRIIKSWAEKPTREAYSFFSKNYSKYHYIARKYGEAGVQYQRGLDFLKSKYPQEDPSYIEEEYKCGYGEVDYNESLRKYFI